jgi:dienelactone hydrolase
MRRRVKLVASVVSCVGLLLLGACSSNNDNGVGAAGVAQDFAVGRTSMTFIDSSRPTAAHGSVPASPQRTIETTVVYPAEGMATDAVTANVAVARAAAPFPLIVLSHGLGGNIDYLLPLAEVWASRGYVVALPRFPLTNSATPGGPVAQDVQNQPGDVSFLINQVLAQSNTTGMLLSNAVDGEEIAASGHSNGGITTYGLVSHSCCRDQRIDAAIVLSGAASPFAGGTYDLSDTPPMLVVQGVNDVLINYNQTVRTYNQLQPPKGFLSLIASDHGSYLSPDDPAFAVTAQTSLDFLDSELRDDSAALERLPENQVPDVATLYWAPDAVSNVPVATLPEPETNRQAFVSADSNLTDGQVITVSWSGFLPEKIVNLMQCSGVDAAGGAAACNISGGRLFYPSPNGMGSLELVIRTGPIGNGVCDSANPCQVIVNDASLTDPEATVRIPITLTNP